MPHDNVFIPSTEILPRPLLVDKGTRRDSRRTRPNQDGNHGMLWTSMQAGIVTARCGVTAVGRRYSTSDIHAYGTLYAYGALGFPNHRDPGSLQTDVWQSHTN